MIHAISPVDGRYAEKTKILKRYFSEFALIKYRVFVECAYFNALCDKISPLDSISEDQRKLIWDIAKNFNEKDAETIKEIERTTNHDVKAVEYFIKGKFDQIGLSSKKEFIHFGLTSQDINNTAIPLSYKEAYHEVLQPLIVQIILHIKSLALDYEGISMLARTHGQPASPTTLGKEMLVFVERLEDELHNLEAIAIKCKFGGATGNFNAHKVAFPEHNWPEFADNLCLSFGLKRSRYTTQIAHYDDLAAIFQNFSRLNTILIDFCRDMWTYVSMEYFRQKTVQGEIGSSAMPHKVNPIDFENAEGNLGVANALLLFMAEKLPISRLQRDLTDSTVLRNIGVPFAHIVIALQSIEKGIQKLELNKPQLDNDLENNWVVISEAIQSILRREGFDKPYELLKDLTRGNAYVSKATFSEFIDKLPVNDSIKSEMKMITPFNYTGYA